MTAEQALLEAQIDAVIEYVRRYRDDLRSRDAARRISSLWDEDVDDFDE